MSNKKSRHRQRPVQQHSRTLAAPTTAYQTKAMDPITIGMSDRSIRVNMALLPAPTNIYDADVWSIERQAGYVALYFGQLHGAATDRLRTRLKLKYGAEAFIVHFWKNSRKFHDDMRRQVESWPLDPLHVKTQSVASMHSDKEHSQWVNFDYLSRSSSQGSLDFYHLPPSALAKFVQGQGSRELELNPVVRVLVTVYQLCEILDRCGELIEDVRKYMPRPPQETVEMPGDEPADLT